jgi:hypothetical protein
MSETQGTSRALLEVVVAVVLVVALAAIFIGALSWLAGIFWTLFKLAVLAIVVYLVVRLLLARRK